MEWRGEEREREKDLIKEERDQSESVEMHADRDADVYLYIQGEKERVKADNSRPIYSSRWVCEGEERGGELHALSCMLEPADEERKRKRELCVYWKR